MNSIKVAWTVVALVMVVAVGAVAYSVAQSIGIEERQEEIEMLKEENQDLKNEIQGLKKTSDKSLLQGLADQSLEDTRAKARDARRISEIKQLATTFEIMDTDKRAQNIPCGDKKAVTLNDTNCTAPWGDITSWVHFNPYADVSTVACTETSTDVCSVSIKAQSKTNNYEVCFYLEKASQLGNAGAYNISTGAQISSGCSIRMSDF